MRLVKPAFFAKDRGALAGLLPERLNGRDPAWAEAWSLELERRLTEIAEGRATLIDAEFVHGALRAELRSLAP